MPNRCQKALSELALRPRRCRASGFGRKGFTAACRGRSGPAQISAGKISARFLVNLLAGRHLGAEDRGSYALWRPTRNRCQGILEETLAGLEKDA